VKHFTQGGIFYPAHQPQFTPQWGRVQSSA
jgi:hypothetical protein